MPGAGCSVPARQERWDTFPRSAADWPVYQSMAYSAAFTARPPPAPGQAPAPSSPPALAWRPAGPWGPELL